MKRVNSVYRKLVSTVIIFCAIFSCFILSSCSSSNSNAKKMPRLADYKVSVESQGKKVLNPAPDLIKRIRISSRNIQGVFGTAQKPKIPELSVARAFDGRSKVMGLEIARGTPVSDALGLQAGDILTAVGTRHIKTPNDLTYFARFFDKKQELSFTFDRKGIARKTILYRVD